MEQSIGRSWVFVGISREIWDLLDGTPPNKGKTFPNKEKPSKQGKNLSSKGKTFRARKNLSKQGKNLSSKEKPFEQGKTFPNKEKHLQTRKHLSKQEKTPTNKEKPFEQGKRLSSKGYLPIKCKSLQVVGVSRQGKAVVSDGGYGVIGG